MRRRVATTAPAQLPTGRTWGVETTLPAPGSAAAKPSPREAAAVAEGVRLYGLRGGVEQGDKQTKGERGGAAALVRAAVALRRPWLLVLCAFTFCWLHGLRSAQAAKGTAPAGRGKKRDPGVELVASGLAVRARLAYPLGAAAARLASVGAGATAARIPGPLGPGHCGAFSKPVPRPELTNYR